MFVIEFTSRVKSLSEIICLSFNTSFASILRLPNELITPILLIFPVVFNLFSFPSPNSILPLFSNELAVIDKFAIEPIALSFLVFETFWALIFKFPVLLIFLLFVKFPLKLKVIFPSFFKSTLFSNDLALIFKVSFAV